MTDLHKWQLLALTLVIGVAIYLLAPVLTPFAAAALLAYLGDPLVDRLERLRISRSLAVLLVFFLMAAAATSVLLLLVPMVERQIVTLFDKLPSYLNYVQNAVLPRLEATIGLQLDRLDPARLVEILKSHWQQAGGIATTVLGQISTSGLAVLAWLANVLVLPVIAFYLLRDWDELVERVRELLPRSIEPTISQLARASNDVLSAFLRGQLSVMLALSGVYSIGLLLVGLDLGLLIGLLAGLVSFIPYLGGIVGIGAGVVAALVQYGDWWHVGLVIAVFGIGQSLEGFLLTPLLVGDKIGLHPVAVIFAIMAGGQLFGFLGVLLALPVAAVGMVLLRYAHEHYVASTLYSGGPGSPVVGLASSVEPALGDDLGVAAIGTPAPVLRAADSLPAPPTPFTDGDKSP